MLGEDNRERERVNKGEYGWGTFYAYMKMEHWNLLKVILRRVVVEDGGYEGDEQTGAIHMDMEMSQWNLLYSYHTLIKTFKNKPFDGIISKFRKHEVLTELMGITWRMWG
jgi:hypothetical protein